MKCVLDKANKGKNVKCIFQLFRELVFGQISCSRDALLDFEIIV